MKFGHNLPRNQVPEWAAQYINYKGLKKLIKSAAEEAKNKERVDLAAFFYALDRNLEDVDGFYNKKYAESARRLKLLHERYGTAIQLQDGIDKDEVQELMEALLELRAQFRKLQWYGEVNRRGFIKITKKLDKKIPNVNAQQRYVTSRVDNKAFATNFKLLQDMKVINDSLSALGDAKTFDDIGSTNSSHSLRTVSSRAILSLPSGLLDTVDQAIRTDDAPILTELLMQAYAGEEDCSSALFQKLLLNLLQRSISCKSKSCIKTLLNDIETLEEDDDLNKRNCIHRLVISIGRLKTNEAQRDPQAPGQSNRLQVPFESSNYLTPAESPSNPPNFNATEQESTALLSKNDESVRLLTFLLDSLHPQQRTAITARDSYGRMPLHYAAQYGFVVICQTVIKHMQDWGQFDVTQGIDSAEWQDSEGSAPLHLSVIGGHALTTKCLLDAEKWQGDEEGKLDARKRISKSGVVLSLATKSNAYNIVHLLVEAGVDINYQDEQGEVALHVAARYGHVECAKALLAGSPNQSVEVDVSENTFSWTPLFIASVDGHLPIVKLLIEAGADYERTDLSGWTAMEHAALRGHLDIVRYISELPPFQRRSLSPEKLPVPLSGTSPVSSSIDERRSNGISKENGSVRTEGIKSFGHRYLTKETMVLVSLGSMDMRKHVPPVKLDDIPLADAHATQLDTALSIVVSASGATGEPTVIDLPVEENISTEPISFTTTDVTKVKILFDIVPTYAGAHDRIVGRGVALLSSIKPSIGSKRITLQGDLSVPIIAANTLEVIGSVNFNFLIITPFSHPNMSITENHTYWKKMSSTMVIGHRGLGKNTGSRKSLQLGENTIQSFIAAANLGAQYVEFDVQLTKDHVPVIYHDFLVSETGIDAPVHTLTLEQFLHVSDQTTRASRPPSPLEDIKTTNKLDGEKKKSRRPRAYSMGTEDKESGPDLHERMKHTRDFKIKGFKGNSRGTFIQAPFTTLEEMFRRLPESIGFNIEMKYPMLHESEEHEMDTYAVELNSFVDTVLTKVYDLSKKRNIIFSSFNPDICLLLSFKQPSIPILFLTDAGSCKVGDIRASSLQEAIRFASRWNLLGIVSASEPLVMCPRLVKVVKESGLVCVSYGMLNNEPKNVALQVNEGIDAVIVDSVLAIRKGLQGGQQAKGSQDIANKITSTINGVPIYENGNGGAGAIFAATS